MIIMGLRQILILSQNELIKKRFLPYIYTQAFASKTNKILPGNYLKKVFNHAARYSTTRLVLT